MSRYAKKPFGGSKVVIPTYNSIFPNKMLIEECKLKLLILKILTYKVLYKNLRTYKIKLKHQANI